MRDAIPMDALCALDACRDARRWLAARTDPSWSSAWRDCERGDWLLWLVGALVCRDVLSGAIPSHGAPSHRRLVGCLVDVLYALLWPWVHDREEAIRRPLEECLDALARYADGEDDVSQEDLLVVHKLVAHNHDKSASTAAWIRCYADAATAAAAAAAYAAAYYAAASAAADAADADAASAAVAAAADASAADASAAGWRADRVAALCCAAQIVRDWYPEAPEIRRTN